MAIAPDSELVALSQAAVMLEAAQGHSDAYWLQAAAAVAVTGRHPDEFDTWDNAEWLHWMSANLKGTAIAEWSAEVVRLACWPVLRAETAEELAEWGPPRWLSAVPPAFAERLPLGADMIEELAKRWAVSIESLWHDARAEHSRARIVVGQWLATHQKAELLALADKWGLPKQPRPQKASELPGWILAAHQRRTLTIPKELGK